MANKVHKIEGKAAEKINALYDASHKAFKAAQDSEREAQKSKIKMWEAIHEAIGVSKGNMQLNTDYRESGLLLVEEKADGEKCPGCGEVHDGENLGHVISLVDLLHGGKAGAKSNPITAILDKIIDDGAPPHVKEAWANIKKRAAA